MKIAKTIFCIVLITAIALCVIALIIYPRGEDYVEKEEYPYANWMTDTIRDDVPLVDIAIPGSHDAGAADLDGSVLAIAKYLLVCQNASIAEQLKCGVRYFDLRTMLDGGELYIQHGDFKTQMFSTVVDDIKTYLATYDDVLILNFQHFTDDAASSATYDYIVETIPNFVDLCVTTDTDISSLTLASMRQSGKRLIVIWGRSVNPNEAVLFPKTEEVLYSPYDGDIHSTSDEALLEHFATYIEGSKAYSGFFNLQCQRTWGANQLLKGPEQLEEVFGEKANDYIANISDEDLPYINIIHRDFVTTADKIETILALNKRKGVTK